MIFVEPERFDADCRWDLCDFDRSHFDRGVCNGALACDRVTATADSRKGWGQLVPNSFQSGFIIRVCAKTSAGQEVSFQQNDPHPDPLPSDGRGNSQPRLSQLP